MAACQWTHTSTVSAADRESEAHKKKETNNQFNGIVGIRWRASTRTQHHDWKGQDS